MCLSTLLSPCLKVKQISRTKFISWIHGCTVGVGGDYDSLELQ